MYFISREKRWERDSGLGLRRAEGPLERGGFGQAGRMVRQRLEHRPGAVRPVFQQDGQRLLQRVMPVVATARMAVDAVEERREVDELVAGVDELEVQKVLLGRHAGTLRGECRLPTPKLGKSGQFRGRGS